MLDIISTVEFREKLINTANPNKETIEVLRNYTIPNKLYKYSKINSHIVNDIKTKRISLCSFLRFNDVHDSRVQFSPTIVDEEKERNNYQFINQRVYGGDPKQTLSDTQIDEIIKENKYKSLIKDLYLSDRMGQSLRIFCISQNLYSTLMWSHYADSHKGICIEYDFNESYKKGKVRNLFFPVIYKNKPIDVTELIKGNSRDYELAVMISTLVKSSDWSYEAEWRLTIPDFRNDDRNIWLPIDIHNYPKCVYLGSQFAYSLCELNPKSGESKDQMVKEVGDLFEFCIEKDIPIKLMCTKLGTFNYEACNINKDKLIDWYHNFYKTGRTDYHLRSVIFGYLLQCIDE